MKNFGTILATVLGLESNEKTNRKYQPACSRCRLGAYTIFAGHAASDERAPETSKQPAE
jgi:hypothetical protein